MVPLLQFIDQILIDLLIWVIIISAIMSWLIAFGVINLHNDFVRALSDIFYRITEPMLRPIRNLVPPVSGVDLSPLILILFLIFLRMVVIQGWLIPLFA